MQGSTMKNVFLAIVIASALPLSACGDDDAPTSPTQPGPPVSEPAPAPEPTPTPPPPTPPPAPAPDDGIAITIRGVITQMSRSGSDGLDVVFRIDDEPIRGDAATTVLDGSVTGNTTYLRDGQTVTIDARQRADHVYAKHVTIDAKP